MITYQPPPVPAEGMMLSASLLNAYVSALDFLLHAGLQGRYPGFAMMGENDYQEGSFFMLHVCAEVYFKAWIWAEQAGAIAEGALEVKIGGHWVGVTSWSTTLGGGEWFTAQEATPEGMTLGTIYEWRVRLWASAMSSRIRIWMLAEPQGCHAPAGWALPAALVSGALSTADWFGDVAACLAKLYAQLPVASAFLCNSSNYGRCAVPDGVGGYTGHYPYYGSFYNYPNKLLVGQWGGCTFGNLWWWELTVTNGNGHTHVYSSYTTADHRMAGRFTATEERCDLNSLLLNTEALGWGFAKDELLFWKLEAFADGGATRVLHAFCAPVTQAYPETGWVAPDLWTMGDTNVGPTRLNKWRDNLDFLYTKLQGIKASTLTPAVRGLRETTGMPHRFFSGIHRHRYLRYYVEDAAKSPLIRYGPNSELEVSLPKALTTGELFPHWFCQDLTAIKPALVFGSIYHAAGMTALMETEAPHVD